MLVQKALQMLRNGRAGAPDRDTERLAGPDALPEGRSRSAGGVGSQPSAASPTQPVARCRPGCRSSILACLKENCAGGEPGDAFANFRVRNRAQAADHNNDLIPAQSRSPPKEELRVDRVERPAAG